MPFNPQKPHRRSIRLKGYDYTQPGALPAHFHIRLDEWVIMPNHFHGIIFIEPGTGEASAFKDQKDPFNIMADASPQRPIGTQPGSLGAIIQNYKSITSRKIHALYGRSIRQQGKFNQVEREGGCFASTRIWQRNYFEHIIRNEADWERIRDYIFTNPLHWVGDHLYGS